MNKQGSKQNPGGGIEWTHIYGPGTGFTANPVRGCLHDCKWRMGDSVVPCYAKTQRERLSGPGSFEQLSFHPEVLEQIENRKEGAGIFIDSMSDLFGSKVPREWIHAVMQTMERCYWHEFFTLTKNTAGLKGWAFPQNVLVGISAPPSFMYGKELSSQQQAVWLEKGLENLAAATAHYKWISIEPLSFDVAPLIRQFRGVLDWAVIGAASDGGRVFQPEPSHFKGCLKALGDCPVFFKGNIDRRFAEEHAGKWRAEFPEHVTVRF